MAKRLMFVAMAVGQLLVAANVLSDPIEMSAAEVIGQVLDGKDFSGQEIIISGVALNQTSRTEGLLNIASVEDYHARRYDNFISVYEITENIAKGRAVKVHVVVQTSMASKIGETTFVLIESAYKKCHSC